MDDAFRTNWVAPAGPNLDAFEAEFASVVGSRHAIAVSSGTSALHLALIMVGVGRGDEVIVSSFTFSASVNPICYLGAQPVFVDSEETSWNMDPQLLAVALQRKAKEGRLPKAVVVVHVFGQCGDIDPILKLCRQYHVPMIEDAAEALGSTYRGRSAGVHGLVGIFSFNGNKIITTSGGGMIVTDEVSLAGRARKLSTQSRDPAPHYEHSEVGYNYRMSNVLAGIGRGQLRVLEDRVAARRANFERYRELLGSAAGVRFMPDTGWGVHSRWLTCLTIDPESFGVDREVVRRALVSDDIEARPLWKPMHLQPVFAGYDVFGGSVSEGLFERGLCLPSGSAMTANDVRRVAEGFLAARERHGRARQG